ncbi:hypothetical protein MUN89_03060 [Halobacillus salinarum]|uniref:Uncharacterized protein n=1 Tax=Halobacillus salinarum TaxID=2932257 RepID=A0ABY4EKF3_9BACI|nr:hypothetical protein [Halobacillus salinarum]UOQ44947.1 hypothetical protein MUN89_03060 [Halobacillus salinarum]
MLIFLGFHILIGLLLISVRGRLPKPIITFFTAFLAMSFIYFSALLLF